jgi:hypothetical protein
MRPKAADPCPPRFASPLPLLALLVLLALPAVAAAWGRPAHRLVAELA